MDPEADQQAMAQMMGFSTFGAQDRPQKKRRYNPGADAAFVSQVQESSTGSNSTPLGARNVAAAGEEGGLDDGATDVAGHEEEGDGASEVTLAQDDPDGGITVPGWPASQAPHGLPQRPAPGTGFVGASSVGDVQGSGGRARDSSHVQDRPWYEGYFDTLSNRNPWERLEKSLDLEPRGTWPSRDDRQTGGSA